MIKTNGKREIEFKKNLILKEKDIETLKSNINIKESQINEFSQEKQVFQEY